MNMETLWDQTCALMAQEMPVVSYRTWVDGNLEPGTLEGDTLYVAVKMDLSIPTMKGKYSKLLNDCASKAAGTPVNVVLLPQKEMQSRQATQKTKSSPEDTEPHLNPKYTFESFVVGNGNRFANAAALAVAESPGEAYNPLFIYGGVGLGKTHLMQAIGQFIHQNNPDKRVLYMTSETFTNELISAIQTKKTYEFREKIRKVDILMIDDIQFIAGRESTQQEFFNTFNELHNENKQIILTSDKPPKDIQHLEDRLCSRFEWGLVADVQRPDVDTRVAILREKTFREGINVPDDVLLMIAEKIDSNIRELEGCLTRLVAYSNMVREPITPALCEIALKEIFESKKTRKITSGLIIQTVSDYYGLDPDELVSATRRREIAVPRQIAMYVIREMTGMSLPQIGTEFGGRDHTTVLHSCKTVDANIEKNKQMKSVVEDIMRKVKSSQ